MENNNKTIDFIRLIYLHLYKDTFLNMMQVKIGKSSLYLLNNSDE